MIRRSLLTGLCMASLALSAVPVCAASTGTATDRIHEVIQLIRQYHLDNVSEDDLIRGAIEGMVQSLDDPYTEYFSREEASGFFNSLDGIVYLIGIQFDFAKDGVFIAAVNPGSPAEQAGLRVGDYLSKVSGAAVTTDNIFDLLVQAQGKKEGDTVTLTILRAGAEKTVTVPYRKTELPLVQSKLYAGGVGYLALATFSDKSEKEFADALSALERKSIRSLVLDLRNNGGGDVEDARKIAARFLKDGVFMYTKDKHGSEHTETISGGGSGVAYPVFVLVNGHTASASEMLAGALQDRGLAKVIGTPTYGKGVIQSVFPLATEEGGFLKVTSEEYFTPNRHPVNHVGIKPDVETGSDLESFIRGFRLAGLVPTELAIRERGILLNGTELPADVPVLREQGNVYIPSRVAAALIGADIEWYGGVLSVELRKDGRSAWFAAASDGIKIIDGTSFVNLAKLQMSFPALHWKAEDKEIIITGK